MDENINLRRIRNRLNAAYHQCHASACAHYADADTKENEESREVYLAQGRAYEVCAGMLEVLIKLV